MSINKGVIDTSNSNIQDRKSVLKETIDAKPTPLHKQDDVTPTHNKTQHNNTIFPFFQFFDQS